MFQCSRWCAQKATCLAVVATAAVVIPNSYAETAITENTAAEPEVAEIRQTLGDTTRQLERIKGRDEATEPPKFDEIAAPQIAASQITVPNWVTAMELSGGVEVEAFYSSLDNSNSDVAVATFELGLSAPLNERVSADVVFLYEEDDTPFGVDSAILTVGTTEKSPVTWRFGQLYIPFGRFETHLVNDTFALELAEAAETVVMASMQRGSLLATGYLFNGNVEVGSSDTIENFGFRVDYSTETLHAGVDLISNALDTDALSAAVAFDDVDELPTGISLYGTIKTGGLLLMGELLSISEIDTSGLLNNRSPQAIHLEASSMTQIDGQEVTWAVALQTTDDLGGLLPEQRFSLGFSTVCPTTGLDIAIEFWQDSDYGTEVGGSDESGSGIVGQIAMSF